MKATIIIGDTRQSLKSLDEKSVQTCITSPPYWGLRDYGMDSQIGLEQTPDEYVAEMVNVFREVWRVLRDDGTLWLNIGDSYSGSGKGPAGNLGKTHDERNMETKHSGIIPNGLKPKDLVGIPWRVAFALQSDGWYLRQDIIWAKPNPMPESVTDRCTKSHEYVFLLTKSQKYYFDNEAIKEPAVRVGATQTIGGKKVLRNEIKETDPRYRNGSEQWGRTITSGETRNKRDVWTISTKPFKGAHFAVMPEALVEPCILAGTPLGGCCSKCQTPYQRQMKFGEISERSTRINTLSVIPGRDKPSRLQSTNMETIPKTTIGWIQSCDCEGSEPQPSLVLDPFTGRGTVGVVAINNKCDFIGTELNPEYAKIAEKRIYENNPMFGNVEVI